MTTAMMRFNTKIQSANGVPIVGPSLLKSLGKYNFLKGN